MKRCLAHIEIHLESVRRGGSTRTAACTCGWRGPQRGTLELAVDDALLHERSDYQIVQRDEPEEPEPQIREAATAGLATCGYCTRDFRRVGGIHIGSQRLGMIPDAPCHRVFATCGDASGDRPWLAYIDGAPLRKKSGEARRYASAETAYRAARKAAPRMWHP